MANRAQHQKSARNLAYSQSVYIYTDTHIEMCVHTFQNTFMCTYGVLIHNVTWWES